MQEAISLDTHLSWTVYLQTGRREEIGEHHSPARALPPPCSSCSTHRAEHQQRQVPLPGALGWGGSRWPGDMGGQDSQEQQRPCLRTPSSMVRQKLQ